jgi:hypothetical protein
MRMYLTESLGFIPRFNLGDFDNGFMYSTIFPGWVDIDFLRREIGDVAVDALIKKKKLIENIELEF